MSSFMFDVIIVVTWQPDVRVYLAVFIIVTELLRIVVVGNFAMPWCFAASSNADQQLPSIRRRRVCRITIVVIAYSASNNGTLLA